MPDDTHPDDDPAWRTDDGLNPEQRKILATVEAEMRPGGRPIATYHETNAARLLPVKEAASLTSRMLRNIEERLVAVESGRFDAIPGEEG